MTVTMKMKKPKADPTAAPPPKKKLSRAVQREVDLNKLDERWEARRFAKELEEANGNGQAPPPHPATTSTATPAGILANDANAGQVSRAKLPTNGRRTPSMFASQADRLGLASHLNVPVQVSLDSCHPHPDNRHLENDPDLAELAASIQAQGQLQPITVRIPPAHWGLPPDAVQVVFGERRLRACRLAGLESISAFVREDLDDAKTLELIATENGQRKDLDPIEKGRLVERLCQPIDEGGAGLTREQAAKRIGLDTGAAASNLVRLLELPEAWKKRVASGELPWTWAREILPYLQLGPVMEHLDNAWKEHEKGTKNGRYPATFSSRSEMLRCMGVFTHNFCRRVEETHWTGEANRKLEADVNDPKVREQLGIVEAQLPSESGRAAKKVLIATKADAFDEMLKREGQRAVKERAAKVGRDEPFETKAAASKTKAAASETIPTEAETTAKAEARAKQLGEHIALWRHKLLRREIARRLVAFTSDDFRGIEDTGLRVVLGYLCERPSWAPNLEMCLAANRRLNDVTTWDKVCRFRDDDDWVEVCTLARHILALESDDHRGPVLSLEFIESYARELQIDLAQSWGHLQEMDREDPLEEKIIGHDLLEEFFLLHQSAELMALAAEFGTYFDKNAKREAMVRMLLSIPQGTTRRLPLPKSIKPVEGVKPTLMSKLTPTVKPAKKAAAKKPAAKPKAKKAAKKKGR